MATEKFDSSNEVTRREFCCNGIYLGSITATEADAIAYFRDTEEGSDYFHALDLDTPHVWTAKPLFM
jgi:hypothetical protein